MSKKPAKQRLVRDKISYYSNWPKDSRRRNDRGWITTITEYYCGHDECDSRRYLFTYTDKQGRKVSSHYQDSCMVEWSGGVEAWRARLENEQPDRITAEPVMFDTECEMKVEVTDD